MKQCECFLTLSDRDLREEHWPWEVQPHLCDYDLSVSVDGAVVDHADDRDSEVTADPERDAEAEAAHDGDDVAAREPEARAVAQRRFLLFHLRGTPIFRQLDHLTRLLLLLHHPVKIDTALLTFYTLKHIILLRVRACVECSGNVSL